MEVTKTDRGFALAEFDDFYGHRCSVQKSSLAEYDCIWLGVNDPKPQQLHYGEGWRPYPLPEGVQCTTRMHLDREQVSALLPLLQRFADTGELDPARAALSRSTVEPEGAAVHESAWLIETRLGNGNPAWLSNNPCRMFSTAAEAVRFDSKQDAEAVITSINANAEPTRRIEMFATEHLFYAPAVPSEQGEPKGEKA
jgi:hypothetical protein